MWVKFPGLFPVPVSSTGNKRDEERILLLECAFAKLSGLVVFSSTMHASQRAKSNERGFPDFLTNQVNKLLQNSWTRRVFDKALAVLF